MDFLSKIDAIEDADTAPYVVRHPATNKPVIGLILAGPTHPNMLAYQKKQDRKLSAETKRARDFNKGVTSVVTASLDDADVKLAQDIERLNAATVGWFDVNELGEAIDTDRPFDPKVVDAWYRAKRWLRDAVSTAITHSENFTKSSASN